MTHRGEPGTLDVKMAKARSMAELDNVMAAAQFDHSETVTHGHRDWQGVEKYTVRIKMANVDAIYQLTIGIRKDGEHRLHDIRLKEDRSTYAAKAVAVQENLSNTNDAYTSASDTSMPQNGQDVNEQFSIPERDAEYMEAVESGDEEKQEKLVKEAAEAAGYDTPKLYQGSPAFGFTEFDMGRGEGLIFATSDRKVAETYSGKTERSRISERSNAQLSWEL